jgi:Flp pilus assembly protein TadB
VQLETEDAEGVQEHAQRIAVLESGLKAARDWFLIAAMLAALMAVVGIVGLLSPGRGPIFGLVFLVDSAILLSFALRQRAKRDECERQLAELEGEDTRQTPQNAARD